MNKVIGIDISKQTFDAYGLDKKGQSFYLAQVICSTQPLQKPAAKPNPCCCISFLLFLEATRDDTCGNRNERPFPLGYT